MSWLGRNAVIGLGVGLTISTGLIALFIIKEALRRRNRRRLLLHNTSSALQNETGMNQNTSHSRTWSSVSRVYDTDVCVCVQWTPRLFPLRWAGCLLSSRWNWGRLWMRWRRACPVWGTRSQSCARVWGTSAPPSLKMSSGSSLSSHLTGEWHAAWFIHIKRHVNKPACP